MKGRTKIVCITAYDALLARMVGEFLATHVHQQVEQAFLDARSAGASEPDALRRAQEQFTNWDQLAREINDAERKPAHRVEPTPGGGPFSGMVHDLRYAFRFFLRNPLFAGVAAVTLAFGIAGNTAVFTLVDAIAIRSLPYPEADRIRQHLLEQGVVLEDGPAGTAWRRR